MSALRDSRPKASAAAFTLVELLVVIAIIAILAAIAVPAYSGFIAGSKSSKCLSNMRQLATALLSCAADNNGYLPRANMNTSPDGTKSSLEWNKAVYLYIPTLNNTIRGKQVDKVFLCPAEEHPPDKNNSCFQYTTSFALEAGNSSTTATGKNGNGPRAMASIQNPSKTILLVDGKIGISSYPWSTESASTWNAVQADIAKAAPTNASKISFRHSPSGAMNVAYADGHVGTIRWEERNDTNKLSEPIWRGRGY